ncbi:transposase [Maribacter sp. ACAM166]|nr:transposase [Maribacter sp. ACAM166]
MVHFFVASPFIRQHYEPGSSCEFDWGEVKLTINDKLTRFQLAVFTSSYSNYRYAQLYNKQDTMAFMESHVAFFNHTQGSFKEMVYDNMRVAVSKFVGKYHKEPTQALLDLRGHYLFSHRFCNARKGNEKGHVERSVEYIRRKAFAIQDGFTDLASAQSHLLTTLETLNNTKQQGTSKTAMELFEKEKTQLFPCLGALECAEGMELRTDKYATISYKGNRYSVPETLVGKFVWVKRFSNRLEVYHKDTYLLVATHELHNGSHGWVINIVHYLETFKRKPGALPNSVALISDVYLKEIYTTHFAASPRDFIALLTYLKTHQIKNEALKDTLKRITRIGKKVTVEALKALLGNTQNPFTDNAIVLDKTTQLAKEQLAQISKLLN